MDKIKYEKPVSLNAGGVASVLGAVCSNGDGATDGCSPNGINPQSGGICQTGSLATYNCADGYSTTEGSCRNGDSALKGDCDNGGTP